MDVAGVRGPRASLPLRRPGELGVVPRDVGAPRRGGRVHTLGLPSSLLTPQCLAATSARACMSLPPRPSQDFVLCGDLCALVVCGTHCPQRDIRERPSKVAPPCQDHIMRISPGALLHWRGDLLRWRGSFHERPSQALVSCVSHVGRLRQLAQVGFTSPCDWFDRHLAAFDPLP